MKKILKLSLLLYYNLFTISCNCGSDESSDSKLAGDIKIDGSSTVYPITEAVAEEFRAVHPKVRVTVGVSGTGGGFKKFARNETQISNASRPIKEKEAANCKKNKVSYLELSVAYDGLSVIVNPENDWVDYLTMDELKKYGILMHKIM